MCHGQLPLRSLRACRDDPLTIHFARVDCLKSKTFLIGLFFPPCSAMHRHILFVKSDIEAPTALTRGTSTSYKPAAACNLACGLLMGGANCTSYYAFLTC